MASVRIRIALALLLLVGVTAAATAWAGPLTGLGTGMIGSLLLAWFAARDVNRRIREVANALQGVTSRNPGPRVGWQSPRELASLATAVNDHGDQMQRRLAESAEEHERLRAVLNGMVEGVLVLDAQGRTLLANQRFRVLFSAWGDVEGRTALDVMRRTDVDDAIARVVDSSEAVLVEIQLADDRSIEMHAVRFPEDGEPLGTVAVFHDVTEIRRLEGIRREFVANVSHELRTPLTAIRGFAETMLANDGAPEQREQHLGVILRHSERLAALIEDLLELSKIEGRRSRLDLDPVDVVALARSVLRDLKPRLEDGQLHHTLDATTTHHALADRRGLEQILLNLLDNAIKYTDPGGDIQVRVSEVRDRIRIEVSDTGIGIPEADLSRIFERFYRVDKARSRDLGGTGLGLAIVKHLVQAMNGDVFVESTEGNGSTVSLVLPVP